MFVKVIQSQNTVAVERNMSGSAGPFSGVIGGPDSLTVVRHFVFRLGSTMVNNCGLYNEGGRNGWNLEFG